MGPAVVEFSQVRCASFNLGNDSKKVQHFMPGTNRNAAGRDDAPGDEENEVTERLVRASGYGEVTNQAQLRVLFSQTRRVETRAMRIHVSAYLRRMALQTVLLVMA